MVADGEGQLANWLVGLSGGIRKAGRDAVHLPGAASGQFAGWPGCQLALSSVHFTPFSAGGLPVCGAPEGHVRRHFNGW